jgi:hypothetical protein
VICAAGTYFRRIALNQRQATARVYARRENTMNAAEPKLSATDKATRTLEGGIRAIVHGNRPSNAPESYDDILAVGATSIADIEKLIEELQTARDYLRAEGERLRRLTTRYAHLTQTASASVKIISESLGKWRNSEQESPSQAHAARSDALSPSVVPAIEQALDLS